MVGISVGLYIVASLTDPPGRKERQEVSIVLGVLSLVAALIFGIIDLVQWLRY